MKIPYECIIQIFSYCKLVFLCKILPLNKKNNNLIHDVIKLYNNKSIKKYVRYSVRINNNNLFILLQNRLNISYLYHILRYAYCIKNDIFVNHILSTYTIPFNQLCQLCISLIMYNREKKDKHVEIQVYKLYYSLVTKDLYQLEKYYNKYDYIIDKDFLNNFHRYYRLYIKNTDKNVKI